MCSPFALPNCAAVHCPLTNLINACAHSHANAHVENMGDQQDMGGV